MNDTASHRLRRGWGIRALPLVLPALLAAACGPGIPNIASGGQTREAQALRYAQCLQQHGIDAAADGQNVAIGKNGETYSQQQMQAAEGACQQYQPGGGGSRPPADAQQLDRVARFVQCMNQHGVPTQERDGAVVSGGADPVRWDQASKACEQAAGSGSIPAVPGPGRPGSS